MKALLLLLATLALAVCGIGCNKGLENNEAVRQAVIDHLANKPGLNIGSMDVAVTNVQFKGNEAEATVSFKPKGGGEGEGMSMPYTLEKQGNKWVVKPRAGAGGAGNPHGGAMMPPPGAPSAPVAPPAGAAPSGELPQGHPPVGGDAKK